MQTVNEVLIRDPERLASVERARRVLPSIPTPLDRIAYLAARLVNAPIGELTLVAADEEYFSGVWGAPDTLAVGRRQSLAYSVCKYAVSADRPVMSSDMVADPDLRPHSLVTEYGVRSFLSVPLRDSEGRPIGSVSVLDTRARPWTDADITTLTGLADLLGPVPTSEPPLRQQASEWESESLLDAQPESFVAVDAEGAVVAWNRASEELYGWTAEEALDKHLEDLIRPERAGQSVSEMLAEALTAPESWRERRRVTAVHRSGRTTPAELRLSVMHRAEGPVICCSAVDVSEQVAVEQDAARDRRFLSALVENLTDAVIAYDAEGRVVLFNPALREVARAPDVGSQQFFDTLQERLLHTDGTPMAPDEMPLNRAVRGKLVRDVDVLVKTPRGLPRIFVINGQPIRTAGGRRLGAVVVIREVTEQRRNERFRDYQSRVWQVLRDSQTITEAAPPVLEALGMLGWAHVELWLVDHASITLRPLGTSSSSDGLAGSEPQLTKQAGRFANRVWATGTPLWRGNRATAACRKAAESGRKCEHFGLHTVLGIPVADAGDMFGALICFAEVPEAPRKILTGQLAAISGLLGHFLARLRATQTALELARSRHDFVSLISNEIRVPLTSLNTGVEQLLDESQGFAEGTVQALSAVRRNASELRAVLDDLLDLAALESGALPLTLGRVDLVWLVSAAIAVTRPVAMATGVQFNTDLPDRLVIQADRERLLQAIANLLTNAVKYSPSGGDVWVRARRIDHIVELTVTDAGTGFPVEERHQAFRRFYRSYRGMGDTGLGLALARAIVESHGGAVGLEVGQHPGTSVVVRLPATATSPIPPRPSTITGGRDNEHGHRLTR